MAESPKLLKIDLTGIIRSRLGSRGKLIPRFMLRGLEKLIHQEELNDMLETAHPAQGSEFSRRILEYLGIDVEVEGLDRIPEGEAFVFASNHPLGGMDGIALVAVLGEKYGDDNIRVLVNDLLLNVEPLRHVFLPINKFGSQGREGARKIKEAYTSGQQIVMFPAGLVSRLHPDKSIHDLEWQKSFVTKALEFNRRIVPIRFQALNRRRFYQIARLRKLLRIPVNLEQTLLPSELCRSRNAKYKITFLPPVDPTEMRKEGQVPTQIARKIQDMVEKV